jgi:hypothetical protein
MNRNNSHTPQSLPLLDGFRPLNEFEARKAVPDIVTCGSEYYVRFAGSDESLRQASTVRINEHPSTQVERCRILCAELGLEEFISVSRENKFAIAKGLKPEVLCNFEEFKPRHPLYQQISTLLSKMKYSEKPKRMQGENE